jgi:hypothetical protein
LRCRSGSRSTVTSGKQKNLNQSTPGRYHDPVAMVSRTRARNAQSDCPYIGDGMVRSQTRTVRSCELGGQPGAVGREGHTPSPSWCGLPARLSRWPRRLPGAGPPIDRPDRVATAVETTYYLAGRLSSSAAAAQTAAPSHADARLSGVPEAAWSPYVLRMHPGISDRRSAPPGLSVLGV